jgi:hypothetical protein
VAYLRREASSPAFIAVLVLFAGGIALRGWFMLEYRPAFLGYVDSWVYVRAANDWLFGHVLHPADCPLFLRLLRDLNENLRRRSSFNLRSVWRPRFCS